jgi:hypothetical protein
VSTVTLVKNLETLLGLEGIDVPRKRLYLRPCQLGGPLSPVDQLTALSNGTGKPRQSYGLLGSYRITHWSTPCVSGTSQAEN